MKIEAIENLDPDDKALKIFFPGIIPEHIARYNFLENFLGETALPDNPTIIDLACSGGYGSAILANSFPGGRIIGLDIGERYVKKAVDKYGDNNNRPPYYMAANVSLMPIEDGVADLIAAFEIVEHLPKDDQLLFFQQIQRALKPGGLVFVSFPERYSFHADWKGDVVRNMIVTNKHHLYEPTTEEVLKMINGADLNVVGEYGQLFVGAEMQRMIEISRVIPLYPFYCWTYPRNHDVLPRQGEGEATPLTYLFVVQKPIDNH